MHLKSAHRLALVTAVVASLAACEERKTFKHDAEWAAPTRTPRAVRTDSPEGAADAVGARLDDILAAAQEVKNLADADKAVAKMKTAYADLETYYAALAKQEPRSDGPNRQAVARRFFQTQQELARSVADLFEKDQKIVEVIGAQLGNMPLVQDPPDPLPADETPGQGIEKEIPVPAIDNPKTPQPGASPKPR